MGEIGSEFWDVPQSNIENGIFPKFTQWFISGRSALQAIIKELKDCRTIAMPSCAVKAWSNLLLMRSLRYISIQCTLMKT